MKRTEVETFFIGNAQNTCDLIGREEYNNDCILLSVSMLYSLTKKSATLDRFLLRETINLEFSNLLINLELIN